MYRQLMELLDFYNLHPTDVTLVRLMTGPDGSVADVACGSNKEGLQRLLARAKREPYLDRHAGWVKYKGVYYRLCHRVEPRDWLDPARPALTEKTAQLYRGFMVDVDALRDGDSATDEELAAAWAVVEEIMAWLTQHVDLSCVLVIMSGNGYQVCVRGEFQLDDQWLACELLGRMKQRWPMVDGSGYKPTVGPAVSNTQKCKGEATPERPHRMVEVTRTYAGDHWMTPAELTRLIQALPPCITPVKKRCEPLGGAVDEWGAAQRLDVAEALRKAFGGEMCPACTRSDSAFAVVSLNVCCCLHERTCPAASTGHRGFTAASVIGMKLFGKWTGYSQLERIEIITAARDMGFELEYDHDADGAPPPAEAVRASAEFFAPEPARRKHVKPAKSWNLHGPNIQECAECLRSEIIEQYCPSYARDYEEMRGAQPFVYDGCALVYHEELGVFVPALREGPDDPEDGEVSRVLQDVLRHGILFVSPDGKPRTYSPWTLPLLTELERYARNSGYMKKGPAGVACTDGFLAVTPEGKFERRQHSPANRALGRLRMSCAEAFDNGVRMRAAVEAFHGLLETLLHNHTEEDRAVIARALLEQAGAAMARIAPETRLNFFLVGGSDVGKSVVIGLFRKTFLRLGLEVGAYDIGVINERFPPPGLATVVANFVDEISNLSADVRDTARLKLLAEGKPWSLNRKNRDIVTVAPCPFMMFGSNHEISFDEDSNAGVKRFAVIRFPDRAPDKLDPDLARRMEVHLDALALAAVAAACRLVTERRSDIPAGSALRKDSEASLRSPCPVALWVAERCDRTAYADTPRDDLQRDCLRWMEAHGYTKLAAELNPIKFGLRLKKAGVSSVHDRAGVRYALRTKPTLAFVPPPETEAL